MTLEEMGALLRQERDRQGISLEKAATEIKISKKYLVALEEGCTGDLPHPVYAKGFVKNYARLLGLDPEEMGSVLSLHYSAEDEHDRESQHHHLRDSGHSIKEMKASFAPASRSYGFKPPLWLALPLLLLFAGLLWFVFSSSFSQTFNLGDMLGVFKSKTDALVTEAPQPPKPVQTQAKPAQPQPAPVKPESKAEAKPESPPAPAATPEPAAPVQRDLLAITPGSGGVKPAPTSQPEPEQDLSAAKLAAESQFATSGNQVVEINANQAATLEVSTEDGQKRSFTLVKGQRLSLRFNDKVAVRFQQAPSVDVKLNGKEYPLEGGKADGRSIQFP